MSFSIKLTGPESLRLSIFGQLDVTSVQDLEPMLARLIARQPRQLEVELSGLRMLDSIGTGTLIHFWKQLHACGCLVTVTGLRDQPLVIFHLLRLDQRLRDFEPEPRAS